MELAKAIAEEDGVEEAVRAFFKHLPRKGEDSPVSPAHSDILGPCFGPIRRCFSCS